MTDIKRMDIAKFRSFGYLQEVNRRFFHPLGLALEVNVDDDGTETLGGVWDYTDDDEGIVFEEGTVDLSKVNRIERRWIESNMKRTKRLGFMVQPPKRRSHWEEEEDA